MRRGLSIGLAVLLALGVVITILVSRDDGSGARTQVARGVIDVDKQAFFEDPAVQAAFRKAGIDVEVDTAAGRQIAADVDRARYDFAFAAGTPQADRIRAEHDVARTYAPFSTPMAIATFDDIARLLARAGVAADHGGWWSFDMDKYLDVVRTGTRWDELPGNTTYPVGKQILVTSSDVSTSSAAAMYAAIASYVLNGHNVVASENDITKVYGLVSELFIRQGVQAQSTEEPFDDYLSIGEGKAPMVMIYESQFVARAARHDGSITSHMVLMYPDPDIVSRPTLVPLTPLGDRIGRLLMTDPALQELAVRHGFRTATPGAFARIAATNHLDVAPELLDVIEPPTYDNLEALVLAIASREQIGEPSPTTTTITPTTTIATTTTIPPRSPTTRVAPSTTGAP